MTSRPLAQQAEDPTVPPADVAEPIPNAVTDYRQRSHPGLPGESGTEGAGLAEELRRALEVQRVAQEACDGRTRQQATIVRLGLEALASHDLDGTLELLVREAAAALDADFCAVLQLGPDRLTFTVRSEFGGAGGFAADSRGWVLGSGQALYTLHAAGPVVCPDLGAESRFPVPPAALERGARSGMSVLLHGKQQPWGIVGVHSKALRTFTEHDTRFLQAIANLMALAIEREAIEKALRSRNRQQAAVVRLGLEALSSRDLHGTLDLLVREAAATLRVDFGCVLEFDGGRSTFTLRASVGWPLGSEGIAALSALGDSQAHYTVQASTPVVCSDLRRETRFTIQPLVLEQGAVSGMSVVLQGQQQVWGVLGAHTKTPRVFTADDTNFLQAIANLMALAIERDRAESALRSRSRQQAAVAVLGRRALAGPHLDDLFAEAAREVSTTLQVEVCEILQRSADGRTLLLRAGIGWPPGLIGTVRAPADPSSQAGFALGADGPVLVADLDGEDRFTRSMALLELGVVSGMSVAIPTRTGRFGVLGAHTSRRRAFTQDDTSFLQAVANLLAGAIERHRVEGDLRRHRDDLEGLVEQRTALLAASNRELEAFSYTISHDLRAPLRGINGLSKILQRKHGSSLGPEARTMLDAMAAETIRMARLIESILALSRLGSVALACTRVDVSAAAATALQTLQDAEPGRKVAWEVEPALIVYGDDGLIRIIVENLVGNAWKFTAHKAEATISVRGEPGGFRVTDTGAGFDMAHAREMFQPFHRLHSVEEFEGTGIGLATVRRIVGRHGGRVWAQGVAGQGATFHIALPPEPAAP